MFIANLNDNNDSPIGQFAGNRLNLSDIIIPRSYVIRLITTMFG